MRLAGVTLLTRAAHPTAWTRAATATRPAGQCPKTALTRADPTVLLLYRLATALQVPVPLLVDHWCQWLTCLGRTTVKSRGLTVAISCAPSLSATATSEASLAWDSVSAFVSARFRTKSAGPAAGRPP